MALPFNPTGRWRLLTFCWWAIGTLWLPVHAQTANPANKPASAITPAPDLPAPAAALTTRFVVQVQAPEPLKTLLDKHLDIQRFHELPDLDPTELRRLVRQLPANAKQLLGTQGHFGAQVTTMLTEPQAPPDSAAAVWTVSVQVDPGPVAQVSDVLLAFSAGTTQPSPELLAQQERIRQQWRLPVGQAFSQSAWDDAKTEALRTLTTRNHPNAQVAGSLADVDAGTHAIRLALELDPGPAVTLGPLRVEGLEQADPARIQALLQLAGVQPGQPYSLDNLQTAQQRLAQSGEFDSVFVYVDTQAGPPDAAPVVVHVREAKRGRLVLGVGGSTDNGTRLSAEHTWNRVPGLGWRALSKMKLERDTRSAQTDLIGPTDATGWHGLAGIKAERQVDDLTTTTSQQFKWGRAQTGNAVDRSHFVQYDRAVTQDPRNRSLNPASSEASITANMGWTRRRFDSLPFPTAGYGLAVELGVGTTLNQARDPFVRARARWQGLWSPESATAGRLAMRLDTGVVAARLDAPIPDTQLFLTGGDQTVRGYGLRDIGVVQSDGSVSPGRLMWAGSMEWQRPVYSQGTRTPWETALFVDAGAVANQVSGLKTRVGVGAGVRYNSPVGPLQMDLAYGVSTKRFRLHLSVGFSF